MPSTYTTSGIELIATGEQSGVWGDTTNVNLQIIDRLTSQAGTITLSGTTHTLTLSNGTLSDGHFGVLVFGGTPSGTNTVTISPNTVKRIYIVRNISGQTVVLTQGSGGNVSIGNNRGAIVYSDGQGASAAVVDLTTTFNFQPLDAELTAIAALATTDGNFIVGNGSTWVAESGATARTSLGLGSIATQNSNSVSITGGSITGITDLAVADGGTGASTAANARTNLGLAIGTNVQAWDVNLDQIAALAVTDGNFIVGNGSAWVAESGATARTSLGLGSIATQNSNSITITGGSITGITDLAVADGGTGASDAAGARTNLGLVIGTDVLAYDANLQGFVTAFTLPTTDGTNGQFLTTNGAGTLQFTSASSTSPQADTVNVTTSTTSSAFKIPFANTTASTTGYYGLLQDSTATFTYNPSTNTLTVDTVAGNLSGNATTATTATNATNVALTTSTAASAFKIPFANTTASTTGNYGLLQDSTATFTYNPSTNTLTVDTVAGALSGNATTATTLQTARNINGTSFNGSGDITTANWGTSRTIWGQSINGSANITAPVLPAAGSVSAPAFSTSGDTNTGMFFPAADTLAFAEGGVEVIRINSSGDVGIGTTTPSTKLDVGGTTAIKVPVGTTAQRPTPATGQLRFNSTEGSFEGYDGTAWGSIGGGAVNDLFYENAQTVAASYTIPATRNAMTTGPITINSGVSVTVSSGARWVII